jgi:bacterioferritin-associated ferredoxin
MYNQKQHSQKAASATQHQCHDCWHSYHLAGDCDKCNCQESEVIQSKLMTMPRQNNNRKQVYA